MKDDNFDLDDVLCDIDNEKGQDGHKIVVNDEKPKSDSSSDTSIDEINKTNYSNGSLGNDDLDSSLSDLSLADSFSDTDIDKSFDDLEEITLNDTDHEEQKIPPDSEFPEDQSPKKTSPKEEPITIRFTVKGNRSWNTREPYTINIDSAKLRKNYDDLKISFHFIEKTDSDASSPGKIKIAMLQNIRGGGRNLTDRYKEFIYKTISLQVQEFSKIYGLKGDDLNLFIYHSGVLTFYRILFSSFHRLKIGTCYKRLSGNRIVKHFPDEYIKEMTLNWFEDNINIYNIPYNGIHEYNEAKRIVTSHYHSEVDKYNKKLDEIIIRLKLNLEKKFHREEYFRSKWDEWFGGANILVYNRFIERTIFKSLR